MDHRKIALWGGAALAVGALLAWAVVTPASAADLGGNCCADLEERIAELEATTARKGNRKVELFVEGQIDTAVTYLNLDTGGRNGSRAQSVRG